MATVGSASIAEIAARGSIRADDVTRFAGMVRADGLVDAAEADILIELHDACAVQDAAWPPFFVSALTDYIVHQAQPEGYVNATNARWLLSRTAPTGGVRTRAGFDLLISVLENARWAPVGLSRFLLDQVLRAVRDGDGPLRAGLAIPAATITAADVALLRRILCAFGSDGHVAMTRAEAEVLFSIDAVLGAESVETGWSALFASAICNLALSASGYTIPTREAALSAAEPGAGSDGAGGLPLSAYRAQSREERALARLERQRVEIITNEQILGDETPWLCDRLRALSASATGASPAVKAAIGVLSAHIDMLDDSLRGALVTVRDCAAAA